MNLRRMHKETVSDIVIRSLIIVFLFTLSILMLGISEDATRVFKNVVNFFSVKS